jgi:integrase
MATIETRVGKDGSTKSYRVKVRRLGEKPRTRTFDRLTDAKAWATSVEADLSRGLHVPDTAERRRTLADLIDAYFRDYLPVRRMRDDSGHRALLEWWRSEYGRTSLERLRPELIAQARGVLLKRRTREGAPVSGATVNRYLTALSAVCKWAWKELQWLPANPVLAVTKVRESAGIVRFLSEEERTALLDACRASGDPNIYCAVMLALATGARYSNIRELKWEDVDFANWRLRFVWVKNGHPRYVPVVGAAKAVLQAQYEADPTKVGWVFKGRGDHAPAAIEKQWRIVRDVAKLDDFRFHDLRHTAASYLTMNGATLAEVAEILGHRTLVMAKRYSHQSGEHVRATLEKMAERFL